MSTRIKVGTYQLGFRWVDLYIDPSVNGGQGCLMPGLDGSHPRAEISVGTKGTLGKAWGTLLHEVFELACCDRQVRFEPTHTFCGGESDCCCFHFDHTQYSELANHAGWVLFRCRAAFERAWRKANRPAKKKGRRK